MEFLKDQLCNKIYLKADKVSMSGVRKLKKTL